MKDIFLSFLRNNWYAVPFFILLFLGMTGWAAALFCLYLLNREDV